MIEALAGAAVGVLTIVTARLIRGERWLYAVGLVTLPSLYAFFALRVGEPAVGLQEMIYGIPYIAGLAFAVVSVRQSAVVVGVLWILHGLLYDLAHGRFITNPGVPGWYPVFCFVIDAVVGAYLLWLSRRIPGANLREA